MPPRITRKSYRPRASDRTVVDNVQPRSLSCFRIRKRRHENRMDLRRANTSEPLNWTWAGERSEHFCSFQSSEMFFLLTLPFIERIYWTSADPQIPHVRYPDLSALSQSRRSGLLYLRSYSNVKQRDRISGPQIDSRVTRVCVLRCIASGIFHLSKLVCETDAVEQRPEARFAT